MLNYQCAEPAPTLQISVEEISNAELAIALLNSALRYHSQTLRLGAAMLSSDDCAPEEIARLAILERCEAVVRYIADCGSRFEPRNPFWPTLLGLLPQLPPPKSSVVPHPTRFVAMSGTASSAS